MSKHWLSPAVISPGIRLQKVSPVISTVICSLLKLETQRAEQLDCASLHLLKPSRWSCCYRSKDWSPIEPTGLLMRELVVTVLCIFFPVTTLTFVALLSCQFRWRFKAKLACVAPLCVVWTWLTDICAHWQRYSWEPKLTLKVLGGLGNYFFCNFCC